jgi:hypothetical protein
LLSLSFSLSLSVAVVVTNQVSLFLSFSLSLSLSLSQLLSFSLSLSLSLFLSLSLSLAVVVANQVSPFKERGREGGKEGACLRDAEGRESREHPSNTRPLSASCACESERARERLPSPQQRAPNDSALRFD